jgi:hypothetical protein
MAVKIEMLPGEPILIQTLDKEFNFSTDGKPLLEKTIATLDAQSEPIFYIADMSEVDFSLDDMIGASNLVTRQVALFRHPKMREGIIITESWMMGLAAKGLNSPIFGNIKVKVFKTRDEALAYVREAAKAS